MFNPLSFFKDNKLVAPIIFICAIFGWVAYDTIILNNDFQKKEVSPTEDNFEASKQESKLSSEDNFEQAMKVVMKHEGGLSDDKNDRGGVTRYGISLRFLKAEKIDVDGDGDIDRDDIIHLTRTAADKIYFKEWYMKYHYDEILDVAILTDILDFSINVGASQCHKTVRRAINAVIDDPIEVNGKFDKEVIEIINLMDAGVLHSAINNQQKRFYRSLVEKNSELKPFLNGWLRRADD